MDTEFYPLFPPVTHFNVPMPEANLTLRKLQKTPRLGTVGATYQMIMECLETVMATPTTYNAIRGDINTLCNWAWLVQEKDIIELTLADLNAFINFCNAPPAHLIGKYSASLIDQAKSDAEYIEANPNWRPFVNRDSAKRYQRAEASLKAQLSNLSFVFTYFEDVEYSFRNPAAVALRRLTAGVKKDLRPDRSDVGHKGLSSLQLNYAFQAAEKLAEEEPAKHERTRFLLFLMVFCYPRVSEVSARPGYSPVMGDFEQHRMSDTNETYATFYIPHSKGGKTRKVVCAPALIDALKRYRQFRGLGATFPTPDDESPLFVRHRAATRGRDVSIVDANLGVDQISDIVSTVFERAADMMLVEGYDVDSAQLRKLTPHSLRHTGISIDLNAGRNPRHVMLDAGHSSESTLTIYQSKRSEFRAESVGLKADVLQGIVKPRVETQKQAE